MFGIEVKKDLDGYEFWVGDMRDSLIFQFAVGSMLLRAGIGPLEMEVGESMRVEQAENEGLGKGRLIANLSSGCIRHWLIDGSATIFGFWKRLAGENALCGSKLSLKSSVKLSSDEKLLSDVEEDRRGISDGTGDSGESCSFKNIILLPSRLAISSRMNACFVRQSASPNRWRAKR